MSELLPFMRMSLNSTSAGEIRSLERRVASDPGGLVFARLADAYRKAGLLTRALEVVERGLDRHPDYLNARLVRARILRDLGHRSAAGRAFEAVLEIDASNPVALRALGDLAGEIGDFAAARTWYARLLEAEPFAEEPVRALLERLARSTPTSRPPLAPAAPATGAGPSEGETTTLEPEPVSDLEEDADRGAAASPAEAPVRSTAEPSTSAEEGAVEPGAEPAERAMEPGAEPATGPSNDLEDEPIEVSQAAATEDAPPESSGELMTPTLADLYLQQGLLDEAIRIYERLVARRPDDQGLAGKLEAARARAATRSSTPRAKARDAAREQDVDSPRPGSREEAGRGPSIRLFLEDLISGRPGGESLPAGRSSRFEDWLRATRGE